MDCGWIGFELSRLSYPSADTIVARQILPAADLLQPLGLKKGAHSIALVVAVFDQKATTLN
jgi:hypothetical protein